MALQASSRSEIIRDMREQVSFYLYNSDPDRAMATQLFMDDKGSSPVEVADLELLTMELEYELKKTESHASSHRVGDASKNLPRGGAQPSSSSNKVLFSRAASTTTTSSKPREASSTAPKPNLFFVKQPIVARTSRAADSTKSLLTMAIPLGRVVLCVLCVFELRITLARLLFLFLLSHIFFKPPMLLLSRRSWTGSFPNGPIFYSHSAPLAHGVVLKPGQEIHSITVFYCISGYGRLEPCRLTFPTDVEGSGIAENARRHLITQLLSHSSSHQRILGRSKSDRAVLRIAASTKSHEDRGDKRRQLVNALGEGERWQLLVASSNGEINEDVPPVGMDQHILRLGYLFFSLKLIVPLQKVQSFGFSHSTQALASPRGPKEGRSESPRILTKVHLDVLGEEKNQYVVVPCNAETLLSALVYNIVRVRALAGNPQDYTFQMMDGAPINMDDHVGDLPESSQMELKMVFKTQSKIRKGTRRFRASRRAQSQVSSLTPVKIGDSVLFTKHTALTRVEYRVIKINKKGKRQQRILGIDRERLTNVPAGGHLIRKKAKRPQRLIRDVVYIKPDEVAEGTKPEDNCRFCIQFQDEKKPLVYEANSPDEAREIIAKVSYILEHIESQSGRSAASAEVIPHASLFDSSKS